MLNCNESELHELVLLANDTNCPQYISDSLKETILQRWNNYIEYNTDVIINTIPIPAKYLLSEILNKVAYRYKMNPEIDREFIDLISTIEKGIKGE